MAAEVRAMAMAAEVWAMATAAEVVQVTDTVAVFHVTGVRDTDMDAAVAVTGGRVTVAGVIVGYMDPVMVIGALRLGRKLKNYHANRSQCTELES